MSLDTELVRPLFTAGAPPGFDAPSAGGPGVVRVGLATQFERDPLVRYADGAVVGAVVRNRVATYLGTSLDFSRRVSARFSLPVVAQWGSELADLSGDGVHAGDLGGGLRVDIVEGGPVALSARADLLVPIGAAAAWVAEEGVRFSPGAVLGVDLGRVDILADAGVTLRPTVRTTDALTVGPELTAGLAATAAIVPDVLDGYVGALGRFGLAADAGPGASSMEALLGARLHALPALEVDLAGGRGLTRGYGGTAYRVFASVTFHRAPADRVAPAETASAPALSRDAVLDLSGIEEAPEPDGGAAAVVETPLARVEQKEIVIRDPLQFERGTDRILPSSQATLLFVARLMNENPDITQLVIEGHASGEGTFEHNYRLSVERALAVFQALVEAGVHPTRLACRGFGEVSPAVAGDDDAARARNRRVVFHIAHRLAPNEPNPGWSTNVRLPWSGEAKAIPAPPPPPPPPAPTGPVDFRDEDGGTP